jgi:hypothetical protein
VASGSRAVAGRATEPARVRLAGLNSDDSSKLAEFAAERNARSGSLSWTSSGVTLRGANTFKTTSRTSPPAAQASRGSGAHTGPGSVGAQARIVRPIVEGSPTAISETERLGWTSADWPIGDLARPSDSVRCQQPSVLVIGNPTRRAAIIGLATTLILRCDHPQPMPAD